MSRQELRLAKALRRDTRHEDVELKIRVPKQTKEYLRAVAMSMRVEQGELQSCMTVVVRRMIAFFIEHVEGMKKEQDK